jgi:histidine triad (HIT) family protein
MAASTGGKTTAMPAACLFCEIASGVVSATVVLDEPDVLGFLDIRPVFPGHVLVLPRAHHETLVDLPRRQLEPLFEATQRVARAVEAGLGAQGTFVAMNNRVSQSVPHLHVHVVPRTKGDGLRGFFWPRVKYESDDERESIGATIRAALAAMS